jgi:LPXTG-site transpeptidase (sortase) family protein
LTKTVNNTTPAVLSNITFTISATNTGPDPATGVVVTENLPSGFTYVSSTTNPNTTTYNNATGLWTIGNMAVNETVTLTITATVNLTGSYVNTAEITASLLIDPNSTPNNNNPAEDDQASVTIVPNFGNDPDPDPNPTPRQQTTTTVQPVVTGFLIPVTGFAPNKVTPLNADSKPVYQPTDLRIEIPTVNVNLPVVGVDFKKGNWDVSWLQDQAGWLAGTSYPTWSGNSVLTAHSVDNNGKPGAFSNLKYLAKGEYIFVYADGYRYTYQVVSNKLLQPTDASVLKHEEKSFITLITCDTYDEASGAYLLRTVVKAALVDVAALK